MGRAAILQGRGGNSRQDPVQQSVDQLFVTSAARPDTLLEDVHPTANLHSRETNCPPCDGSSRRGLNSMTQINNFTVDSIVPNSSESTILLWAIDPPTPTT